ncbi:hypothetical protein J3R82DRAFT_195 [Butyriboletus roseoflavus]|nr:hypothetical protein J3R82DRAFT_195 [Butyriboletus roseoflavus]
MPLLGGLFHKRNAPSRQVFASGPSTATESVASSTSNKDSTDGDHVLPDKSLPPPSPIYNLSAAASSSKLKLPFRRKAAAPPKADPKATPHSVVSLNDAPSPYISSVTSDSGHGLPPPPRKSSFFGVHHESLQSIHSLPNDSSSPVHHVTPSRPSSDVHSESRSPPASQVHKKSPGLLSWARERTKSKPLPPSSAMSSVPSTSSSVNDSSSFNLKSFRHVCADSPATSPEKSTQSLSNSLLAPPRPRPRGDSVASDSSQRISVAAFREAQARSRTNSPVPSFRPPSTADTLRVDGNGRKRASTVSVVLGTDSPQPNKNVAAVPRLNLRPGSSALDAPSDDSESEEDEEVDSDGEPVPKPGRKRTITRRADETRARSNAGHRSVPSSNSQISHTRQDPPKSDQAPFTRPRASVSTSALTPSGAARRASILAATNSYSNSYAQSKHSSRKQKDDTDESTDSSDMDSEDMPLSDLVAPRRPGSTASTQSGSRPRAPPKPLIDIKSLAGGPPLLTPILRHEDSIKNLNTTRKEQDVEKDQPFSIPAVLALSSPTSPPISPSASKQNTTAVDKAAASAHHDRRSSSDVPAKEPDHDEDLMNAIRLVGALDKEPDQPPGASNSSVKSPSDRIVPTPIREREPPTSFTVLSRPPQRHSTVETLASLSPASQTLFNVAPRALPSQPETSARQRPPTTINPTAQNDRSDAVSVCSAARSSTSRSSSRFPPVPLIHTIPDSPSVKEDYKPSRPRATSRASVVEGRSHSRSAKLAPAMSSSTTNKMVSHRFQPSLMPQRPFASNGSILGESPAGSSTGDSSSGRAPFTPRDGSDIGVRSKDDAGDDVGSTLKARGHAKKSSVTFEDPQPIHGRERAKTDLTDEQRTRERRRSEAKAAIELGKIVNGRGPLVHDDPDEDAELRGHNPTINVTMENGANGTIQPGWAPWQHPMASSVPPMVPPQFGNDPAYLAAHQRALFIAKQAYQMAVAQQAMQMAGEEWERSSNVGFGSGGSVYGGGSGGSIYGGGGGGSVYGGGSGGSVYGPMGGMAPMGMMSVPNMGMLMPPSQWGRSSVAFPSATPSPYGGISSSQSEYGGAGGWGSRSVYGDSFGPSPSRPNQGGNGVPNSAASAYGGSSRPRAWTGVTPPSTSSGQSTRTSGKTPVRSRAAPPSSWKNSR